MRLSNASAFFASPYGVWVWLVWAGYLLSGLPTRAQVPLADKPHFEWQSPLPTGFILNDLHAFSAHSAIVVGDGGAALRTADGGQTWQLLHTGTLNRILKVSFGDSLHGWLMYDTPLTNYDTQYLSGKGEVRYTADGGRTWTLQTLGDPNTTLRMKSLQAISATEAFVSYEYRTCRINFPCGGLMQQALRHTTNGGRTWTQVTNTYPQVFDPDLEFPSPTTAYLTGGNIQWVGKSTDGGATWRRITPDTSGRVDFDRLSFVTPRDGWVTARVPFGTGQEPNLYRTRNGGQTWTPLRAFASPPYTVIFIVNVVFADTLHGIVVYSNYGPHQRAISTSDGGQTWSASVLFPSYYNSVRLVPDGSGWATGLGRYDQASNASVGRTLDFGATWTTPFTRVEEFDVRRQPQFFGATRGWIIPNGDSVLLTTTRRGAPWRRVPFTGSGVDWRYRNGYGVTVGDFVDADTGYVHLQDNAPFGAIRNSVLKTTDGGQNWTRQVLPLTNVQLFNVDMRFATSRRGALVGTGGLILVTQDGGQSWQQPPSPTTKTLKLITWIDSLQALAIGDSLTIVRTRDGGWTWQLAPRGQQAYANEIITFAQFSTPLVGYIGIDGEILRTQDGGQTFSSHRLTDEDVVTLPQPIGSSLRSCYLTSPRRGLAFGEGAWGRTTDGGQTWQRLADFGRSPAYFGTAVDDYNAWAVGVGGRILHYSEKYLQTDTTATQPRAYCTGDTLTVRFDTVGVFNPTERNFRVELSNKMGRFRPRQTTLLPLLAGTVATASPLRVTLPAALPAGTRYRLRVIRTDSSVLGGDNEHDITVYARPVAVAVAPADSARICAGDSVQLTAPAGFGQYQWSNGATTVGVWVRAATTLTVRVAGGGGCFGPPSRLVTVFLTPRPAAPTFAQAPLPAPAVGVVLTSSAATGNQWLLNGRPISGATGASYTVTTAGVSGPYTVQVTARGCVGAASAPQTVTVVTGLAPDAAGASLTLTLTPNPATDAVTVTLSGATVAGLTLTDLSGRIVAARRAGASGGGGSELALTGVPTGTYLVRVTCTDGRVLTRRLVVAH